MVQTLATMLMVHKQKPSLNDCDIVAQSVVAKYSFLNDSEGTGRVGYFNYYVTYPIL